MLVASLVQPAFSQESAGWIVAQDPNRSQSQNPVQRLSFYQQMIDPVSGKTAEELVSYALANNGELKAARMMIAEAKGRLNQAALRPNPMFEASGSRAVTGPDNNLNIGAELPLELGGRRRARISVAEREIELRNAEVLDFERKLAAEVRALYYEAIAAARNLKFTEDLLALTMDSHRLIQARVERGKSAPLEQNMVKVELGRVDAMRLSFESKSQTKLFELMKVIGMGTEEVLQLRGEFSADVQPASKNDATRSALTSRADLLAARAAERLAEAQLEQTRTEGKVEASIFAEYMRQNMGFDVDGVDRAGRLAPVQGVFHYATFGVRLTLPWRNKNQGNIESAVAMVEAARKKREFAEAVIRNEVAASYARFERAQMALALYRDSVRTQALRNLDVVRRVYAVGQKSLLEYVSEQRDYIEIETNYTEILKEYADSVIEIERAVGKVSATT